MILPFRFSSAEHTEAYHAPDFSASWSHSGSGPRLLGNFAKFLALDGPLIRPAFSSLLRCEDPSVGILLTQRRPKRCVMSTGFALPKSVSVQALVDDRIVAALPHLCVRFVDILEDFAHCRDQSHGSTNVYPAAGLAAASIPHYLSDARDPHLHAHIDVFLFSAYDKGDKSPSHSRSSVWTKPFFSNFELISVRFMAEAACALRQLGYRLDPDGKEFRIRGVPRELEVVFAKRSNQMNTLELDGACAFNSRAGRQTAFRRLRGEQFGMDCDKQNLSSSRADLGAYEKELLEARSCALWRVANVGSELPSVPDTVARLAQKLSAGEILSPIQTEMDVLRELCGYATADAFSEAVKALKLTPVRVGRHEYWVGGKFAEMMPKLERTLTEISDSSEGVAGGFDEVGRHAVLVSRSKCVVVETGRPERMVSYCRTLKSGMGPTLRIEDATRLSVKDLSVMLEENSRGENRLILCAPHPSARMCPVVCALTSPGLFSRALPETIESRTPHTAKLGSIVPLRAERLVASRPDLLAVLSRFLKADNQDPPLVVTSRRGLAAKVNRWAHELEQGGSYVPRLCKSSLHDLATGASSKVRLVRPQGRMPIGTIASAHNDGEAITLMTPCATEIMEAFRRNNLSLLHEDKVRVGSHEPIFTTRGDAPTSAFSSAPIKGRAIRDELVSNPRGWVFGYAVAAEDLPKSPDVLSYRTVIWCGDFGDYSLTESARAKLSRHLHRAEHPVVIENDPEDGEIRKDRARAYEPAELSVGPMPSPPKDVDSPDI